MGLEEGMDIGLEGMGPIHSTNIGPDAPTWKWGMQMNINATSFNILQYSTLFQQHIDVVYIFKVSYCHGHLFEMAPIAFPTPFC